MAIVKYYLDPAVAAEIDQCSTVGESLLKRWPNGVAPRGLKIYREAVAEPNDVTQDIKTLTTATDDTFIVVIEVGEITTTTLLIISVIIGVASILLAPSITSAPPNANRTQQSPNNSFGARRNEPRVNQRAADVRGKVPNAYPDLLQYPYVKFRNGKEYETLYMHATEGYADILNIKDGGTPFERMPGSKLAVYGPNTSPLGGIPQMTINGVPADTLYTVTKSNEVDGITLKAPNSPDIARTEFYVRSDGRVRRTLGSSVDFRLLMDVGSEVQLSDFNIFTPRPLGGYDRHVLSGTYNVESVSETEFFVTPNGTWSQLVSTGEQLVPLKMYRTTAIPTVWYYDLAPGLVTIDFAPSVLGTGTDSATSPVNVTGYDRVWVNVVATNGLYKDNGSVQTPLAVTYRLTQWELNAAGIRTGAFTITDDDVTSMSDNSSDFTGTTSDVVLIYNRSEITLERVTESDDDFAGTVVDEIKWRDLYLVNDVTNIDNSYQTTIHAEITSTPAALSVKERKINCTIVRKVADYLGSGTFSTEEDTASDHFTDVIASIWRDPLFGRGSDDEVNWDSLYGLYQPMFDHFGADINPLRVGYTFDSDKISAEEAIKLICNAVNVIPYRVGSVLNFWFEGPQTVSTMQFGHRFKHPGTDRRSRLFGPENDKTGVELTYFNEVTEVFETISLGSGINPLKIELSGCITERGAIIRAHREWNKLKYSRIQHQFDATAIGRMVVPGMRIDVIDNTRYAPLNGEIRAVDGLTLTLSQPADLPVPSNYSVVLTRSDGTIESRAITAQPAPNKVTIASAPSEAPYTGRDKDKTAYSIATDDGRTSLAMLVREIDPKDYNRVAVSCINYDERYYADDN